MLIDTPGFSFVIDEDADESTSAGEFRARDILLRSKGRIDRLKDPNPPGTYYISILLINNTEFNDNENSCSHCFSG